MGEDDLADSFPAPPEAPTVGDTGELPVVRATRDPIKRLRWLVPLAVVATGLVIFSIVQTLHYSNTSSSGSGLPGLSGGGFFTPSEKSPVQFSLPRLSGSGDVSFASEGGEPVVINLWATTCTVCVQETPAIESVARTAGSSVAFLGVDTLDERGPAQAFAHRYGVTYPELFDSTGKVAAGYSAPGLPVTVFVSASGQVVGEYLGALTAPTLDHYLKMLFGASP